ncbi:DUF2931 family protein [Marinobacter alexandrii]|uniref:DUF2931 family protein n=1 Tax=Marinobacter alexandrii TaxID=2570351 RepID=UPI00110A0563|nr:DUF2931 family protein [Marinobacter alexandrii]
MFRSVCLVLLLAFFQSGCVSASSKEQVNWYFQIAAPKHYHAWVQYLELEKSGVRHWHQAPGYISCCWQGEGGPTGKGGRMEPFPNYIGIQWVSFADEKVYQKLIEIKSEWREAMREPAPFTTSKGLKYKPRNVLTLGLAPGGEIVVWIKSQVGNELELVRLQGNEMEGKPQEYSVLIEDYKDEHREYLDMHGIPLEGW